MTAIGAILVGLALYGITSLWLGKVRRALVWLALELVMVAVSACIGAWGAVACFGLLAAVTALDFRQESRRAEAAAS